MDSIYDKVKAAGKSLADKYKTGNNETSGIGSELSARSEMNRQGEAALNKWAPKETLATHPAATTDTGKRYGDRPGEKRLDSNGDEIPKYHQGVDSVPKTGLAVLKKGEKVVPAEQNPDNPNNLDEEAPLNHTPEEKAHFHRSMAKLHEGGLHDHFGMKHDEPISMEKKQEAANSDNPHVAAMGHMAVAMEHWHHKHGKK
jgi:hypothetical protein